MVSSAITAEEFLTAARDFSYISDEIGDGWKLYHDEEICRTYLKKELYIAPDETEEGYLRAEYIIFYNLSYGVPAFSFNIWRSTGVLITLEEIRNMGFNKINQEQFYSVITQQEHPIFQRPYFIMHPCHTSEMLENFKEKSKNIMVTFLSLITPLIRLELPMEYGV